ncbi:four-carbon acid sugar kinase family protein [Microbacterium resistens]|uniref:3-oxo-tetronate kinase n=1 Tax=Microbacterium resistens TaxID=156977 RepID=UPI0027E3044C|nr:3-oxo-tetronate kinase [Microbacterium resistens]MBW1639974.1 four-carbon acid sugar kinase family protein [Microbacterium resistens]
MIDIGAVADDFTGATDLAMALRQQGFRAVVSIEDAALDAAAIGDADAVVVALKTRTAPVPDAVAQSVRAIRALEALGARRYYVKYCSTFDSTPEGNIGPILDAVMEELAEERTVVVPSFPDNGRTVYRGHLFVGDDLLENSPMRHHPLTPMTQSRIRDLLAPQTTRDIHEVPLPVVQAGPLPLREALDTAPAGYAVVDAVSDADLQSIATAVSGWRLVSGGAGLALGMTGPHPDLHDAFAAVRGRRLIVCGSASSRTRAQIAHAAATLPSRKLDVEEVASEPARVLAETLAWIREQDADAIPLVYTVGTPDDVRRGADGNTVAAGIEDLLSALVSRAVAALGVTQVIVAGGETSGSVLRGLGVARLHIGPRIAPGVCWSTADAPGGLLTIALKSGNFGTEDMFTTAWKAIDDVDD